jgi:cell division protein FtsB
VVLVWLPMLALLVWGKGGVVDLFALKKQVRELETEVSHLKAENDRLRLEIQALRTDPSRYESIAREQLFLKKPGEVILYLPPKDQAPPAKPAAAPPPSP